MSYMSFGDHEIMTAVRGFLLDALPPGVPVVRGQVNRVPEPKEQDFVIVTPIRRQMLATNRDRYVDVIVLGSITGTRLVVEQVVAGDVPVQVGTVLFGPTLVPATRVVAANADGSFVVNQTQTVPSGTAMYAGVGLYLQPATVTLQVDVHGPNSHDNVVPVATLWRDEFACTRLAGSGYDIQPLYAEDPRQMTFTNGEQQWELRWSVDLTLQSNQIVQVPQEFASALTVELINVDVIYPP